MTERASLLDSGRNTRLRYESYRDDPAGFFRDILGIDPWSRQEEVLESVAENTRTAVRSGHKVSKSCSAAGLAIWWTHTRRQGRVIMTSSGARQVKAILWKELRNRHRTAKQPLEGKVHLDPGTGYQFDDGREVLGYTTDDAERMAGISGPELLFIVDEASGFPDDIYEAILGNMAGGAKVVAFGNPTRTTGWFFDAFRTKAHLYSTIHISSEESPNVAAGEVVVPGLATAEWIDDMRLECGDQYKTHPVYMVRVEGEFPEQATNSVISLAAIEAAKSRWGLAEPVGKLRIGVDVARFGDDETIIWPVRGPHPYQPKSMHGADGTAVADAVIRESLVLRKGSEKIYVHVDGIGVGASVVDALRRHALCRSGEMIVCDINVGSAANDPDDYVNLRSQIWFGLADWIKTGSIPPDTQLERELLAPTFGFDSRNRKKVASKDELKKILGRSPDRADALCLAVYNAPEQTIRYTSIKKRQTSGWGSHY